MADDRSLDEIYQYELKKRSSAEGIALSAIGGDHEALQNFARLAIAEIEAGGVEEQDGVLAWLVYVLARVAKGVEPNKAFGWARKRAGRVDAWQNFAGLHKQWLIGQHMAGLVAEGESQRKAARIVAAERNVSPEAAVSCHREFLRK